MEEERRRKGGGGGGGGEGGGGEGRGGEGGGERSVEKKAGKRRSVKVEQRGGEWNHTHKKGTLWMKLFVSYIQKLMGAANSSCVHEFHVC